MKTPETGRKGRLIGRYFSSRPVTGFILPACPTQVDGVIRNQIAFIYVHIFGFTSPMSYESRFAAARRDACEVQSGYMQMEYQKKRRNSGAGDAVR